MKTSNKEKPKPLTDFEIVGTVQVELRTIVRASSEEEAMKIALDRDISICWHGTEDYDAREDWVLYEGPSEPPAESSLVVNDETEVEEEEEEDED